MPPADVKDAVLGVPGGGLPEGHAAVPVSDQKAALLKICVVVKKQPDGRAGLVVLRDGLDARVYQGCVLDAGGGVVQWVELWVQHPATLIGSMAARRGTVTNSHFDRRWQRLFKGVEKLAGAEILRTGWESNAQPATWIDPAAGTPVHAAEGGVQLVLCRDDALLMAAGLPGYGTSQHRYLVSAGASGEKKFVPLTPEAPQNGATKALGEVVPKVADLLPFNAVAGQMMVRSFAPLSYSAFLDMLLNLGSEPGKAPVAPSGGKGAARGARTESADAAPMDGNGWLFVGQHGAAGRLVEALHLKLRAITDAVEAVAAAVKLTQLPLLNVSAESFRVDVGPTARGLPSLWTARTKLVDPGDTVEWALPGADTRYYLPARPGVGSIYRPSQSQSVQGRGSVRIRQVLPAGAGSNAIVLEGTFLAQERLEAAGRDLVWFRINAGSSPLDVYARLEKQAALAAGEWRFRSVPLSPNPTVMAALNAEEGLQASDVPFEHLPLLASPSDLYSLGVLAVRTLVVNARTSLPVALDEVMSLARQVGQEAGAKGGGGAGAAPLGARIGRVLGQDKRWVESLGPQRLSNEAVTAQAAFEVVPADVWCDVLGWVVRCFAGVGPDSYAKDLGDAPPEGLHAVFARPVEELNGLLLRTRSLIVIDWKFNREVHGAIRESMRKWGGEGVGAGAGR